MTDPSRTAHEQLAEQLEAEARIWNPSPLTNLLQEAAATQDELLTALRKVRAHTSYINPTLELLQGLLQSIERIADAALAGEASPAHGAAPPQE